MSDVVIRRLLPADEPEVESLLAVTLGFGGEDGRHRALLQWKHRDNPFGRSGEWVAVDADQVIGYRAFMRWAFVRGRSRLSAVRAVDTATHPDHQGRGVFRSLTLHAIDELQAEGVDFVFNTPNDQSRPGYLKMGWQEIGRLTPWMRPASLRSVPRIVRGREQAGYWGEPTTAGAPAEEVFHDDAAVAALVDAVDSNDGRLHTDRSAAYLRWRYVDFLGYRVITAGATVVDGACCFRIRRRGSALEATIGDLLTPGNDARARRALIKRVVRESGADYALVIGGSVREGVVPLPAQGPRLVWRGICHTEMPARSSWNVTMGDIELF